MESKVLLYDSKDVKIGETFARRARQLVKQQRASWIDDKQDAIRFAPGMEKMDISMTDDIYEESSTESFDKELMMLARRRVHARFAFKLHLAIALILIPFLIMIHAMTSPGGYFWPAWSTFGLGLSIAIHWAVYKLVHGNDMHSKIAHEYEQLKHRRLYGDIGDSRH
ncbi:MAG: 2TM domain-containing protein [Defluviitaleaceae bacterium]|nr:2TM domain-containing protein [Defluviitaleaceae bacterium]